MNEILKFSIMEFIKIIDKLYKIKFAYVFGSVARGEEGKLSDIDIAVYFEKSYTPMQDAFIRGDIIERGKETFHKDMDVVSLNKATPFLKYEIVREGVVVKDHDERATFESLALREYFDFKHYSDIYNEAIIESIKNETYLGQNQ